MKQKIGTLVLIVLLVLTVVALKHIAVPQDATIGSVGEVKRATN